MKENVKEFEHFRLHTLYTTKFKKCGIEIHFRDKTSQEKLTNLSALLPLTNRGTKKYPSLKEMNKRKEYLYGLSSSCYLYSNSNMIDGLIYAEFLNPKYVEEKEYLEEVIELLFDYLKEPLLSEKDFEIVKDEIKLSLRRQEENLSAKSFVDSKKNLDCVLKLDSFEKESDVDKVTLDDLKEALNDILNNYTIDIYVLGDLDMDEVERIIVKKSCFKNNPINEFEFNDLVKSRNVVEVEDKGKFEQSMIVYFYSLEGLDREERLYKATVLSDVLGGGLNSLLYKDIREKHSLCYNISTMFIRNYNLLRIMVGVDKKNINKAKERIEYNMANLETLINDSNVSDAKLNIINSILSSTDSTDYLLFEADARFCNILDPIDVKLKKYENVTAEDVKSIIPTIKEYTKYVLVGDKNENN